MEEIQTERCHVSGWKPQMAIMVRLWQECLDTSRSLTSPQGDGRHDADRCSFSLIPRR